MLQNNPQGNEQYQELEHIEILEISMKLQTLIALRECYCFPRIKMIMHEKTYFKQQRQSLWSFEFSLHVLNFTLIEKRILSSAYVFTALKYTLCVLLMHCKKELSYICVIALTGNQRCMHSDWLRIAMYLAIITSHMVIIIGG